MTHSRSLLLFCLACGVMIPPCANHLLFAQQPPAEAPAPGKAQVPGMNDLPESSRRSPRKTETPRPRATNRSTAHRPTSESTNVLTPGREAAAMTFARLHHRELAGLLTELRETRPAQYQRAMRDLFQVSERMARIKERMPERYELELRMWTLDSQIRLLAARMTVSSDPALEVELKNLMQQRVDTRLEQLHLDQARARERLERLNAEIDRIEQDPRAAALRDFERIKRNVRGAGRNRDATQPPLKKASPGNSTPGRKPAGKNSSGKPDRDGTDVRRTQPRQ